MNRICYFIRFIWYYYDLTILELNNKDFKINDIIQQGNREEYKIYWKYKNKYWIK